MYKYSKFSMLKEALPIKMNNWLKYFYILKLIVAGKWLPAILQINY